MKIGIISDAHGNLEGFESCLNDMGPVDYLIFAGDLLGYYFDGAQILRRLQQLNAKCILGNHDVYFLHYQGYIQNIISIPESQYYLEKYGPSLNFAATDLTVDEINWLSKLPTQLILNVLNKQILIVHGSPWYPINEYVYPDYIDFNKFNDIEADVIVMGHTHRPMIKTLNNKILLNSGSCGQPRDGDTRVSYGIIEIINDIISCTIHRIDYSRDQIIKQCHKFAPDLLLLTKYFKEHNE